MSGTKTVAVGMSGGVDSSVAALLLKEQGYQVFGIFMKNWEEKDETGVCQSAQDYEDAARVCDRIGIPYYAVEFVEEYRDTVFSKFLEDYRLGFTPNPDILCNREIKFNVFFRKAMEMGADFLATGHYCQNIGLELIKGADPGKDQTYFLYTLGRDTLSKVLFPVGGILKPEVREIARRWDLPTHSKKDSTGICFIGERNFRKFLSQYVAGQPGEFQTLDGKRVGEHGGVAFYTLGQRRGLGLGGEGSRWFVVGKDVKRGIVFVERGELHPALYSDFLVAGELSWVAGAGPSAYPFACTAKARYRQSDQSCTLHPLSDGRIRVEFDLPQRAITPGQSVVFYHGQVCLGGGRIEEAGPSYFEQGKALPAELPVSSGEADA